MKSHDPAPPTAVAVATTLPPAGRAQWPLLSVTDVCLLLQCGRTFVYQLLQTGELRRIKLGRLTRISRNELEVFLAGKAVDVPGHTGGEVGRHFLRHASAQGAARGTPPKAAESARAGTRAAPANAVEQPYLLDPLASVLTGRGFEPGEAGGTAPKSRERSALESTPRPPGAREYVHW
jgi:excisionase family DNA binding protein